MIVKTFILSLLTTFLLTVGASAVPIVCPISGNSLQNYSDYTSLIPNSVNYHMIPVNYLLVGEKADSDCYNIDQTIVTPAYDYSAFYSEDRMFVSYNRNLAKGPDCRLLAGDIIELSVIPTINSQSPSTSEAITIMFMGLGLFTLGGFARRFQKIRETH
ncbi:MAG: hypothetical protein AVO38_05295 [delta proteobacterium ML8_D]|jgi:hypothetical protein|nr:MAG: hypothetical protein AVO38_05295 [delta proteobacterium ML8_D]